MRKILLIFIFCISLFATQSQTETMESISKHAIVFGFGPEKVYIFVDPMCPKSKDYLSTLNRRKDLYSKRTYYIFLYRLNKFDSDQLIQYIYQSKRPSLALEDIMITNKEIDINNFEPTQDTIDKIKEVAIVGEKMKMKRRPYQISFEPGSEFCRVSEGTAACLEEESF